MLQMSSGIACGGSTRFMVPLSLPLSFNSFFITQNKKKKKKKKGLFLDYWGFSNTRRRNVIIKASSDVVSPSIWDSWKPPKSSSTPSFSDILWPSAGSFSNSISFLFFYYYCYTMQQSYKKLHLLCHFFLEKEIKLCYMDFVYITKLSCIFLRCFTSSSFNCSWVFNP